MKNYIFTFSIALLSVGLSNAQETIKDAAVKSAAISERKDTVALEQNTQQEPKKSGASESQNKMAINEQGVNKVKPRSKKSSTSKTDSSKTNTPKEKK